MEQMKAMKAAYSLENNAGESFSRDNTVGGRVSLFFLI